MLIAVIKLNCTDRYSTILLNLRQFSILNFSMSYTKNEIAKYVCRVVCLIALKRMRKIKNSGCSNKVFLIHGFSGTTTDMIQKEAGVSKATMYGCFKNKEAMFAAVIERQCTNMQKQIMSVETKAKNLRSALTEIGKTYLCFILSHSGLAFLESVLQRL